MINRKSIQVACCLLTVCLMILSANNSFAQKNEIRPDFKRHSLSVNVGYSLVGALFSSLESAEFDSNIGTVRDAYSSPAFQVTYDYSVGKRFSIGAGVSAQRLGVDLLGLEYADDQGYAQYTDVVADLTRLNIAARPLFHYGNNPKLDMYTGFRVGITSWLGEVEADGDEGRVEYGSYNILGSGLVPAFQVIPFGMKIYFSERIGMNFETGVGTPHFISGGVSIRL